MALNTTQHCVPFPSSSVLVHLSSSFCHPLALSPSALSTAGSACGPYATRRPLHVVLHPPRLPIHPSPVSMPVLCADSLPSHLPPSPPPPGAPKLRGDSRTANCICTEQHQLLLLSWFQRVCGVQENECHQVASMRPLSDHPLPTCRKELPHQSLYWRIRGRCTNHSHTTTPSPREVLEWPYAVGGGGGTPCVTFRLVVAPLRGPGRSPVLPFACCVGSLLSVGHCGRCSCWCRFRVHGAQYPPPPQTKVTIGGKNEITSKRGC